ncbi:MAG: tRNA (adenosine(37)-N6)-dimethylallyltransferase MiaA [Bdellovibrionales bacterium]|nr:tRNA (adenosine(37)-N6)-dimethylallyltransferase MiaA [Bdellovibrionales bacterium]
MNKNRIAFLVGPTASGKSSLALELAQKFGFEIVNADRMQCYRHLSIGTAKPSPADMAKLPHHLYDWVDPDKNISVADYAKNAHQILQNGAGKKSYLVVGGSGFYLQSLLFPPLDIPKGTMEFSDADQAYKEIQEKDPELCQTLHPNDHYRISRALFLLSKGFVPSREWKRASKQKARLSVLWMGLDIDKETLTQRIQERTRHMLTLGLMEETQRILSEFPKSRAVLSKIIGYKQCMEALEKKDPSYDLEFEIQKATRHYAKQQKTWFARNTEIHWESPKHAQERFSCYIEQSIVSPS